MQVDKVVTHDVGIPASPDSHDYGAGAACCREAGRRVLHDQRWGCATPQERAPWR
ncbi:hypothetical protein JCM18909_3373 [Cutibacterium acnes JCM 18909]|nr:hypothetical protein JCM18909_3373 [Cutibacterium acnes JCM 18909]